MGELPIGVAKHEYRHSNKSKEGGSLAFAYSKDGWLANTVGHLLAIPVTHLPLLTLKDVFRNPSEELVQKLSNRWKDVSRKGDMLVRVGHASFIGDIKRMLATDQEIKGRAIFSTTARVIDRVARYLSIPIQLLRTLAVKMTRSNYYDPITNTLNLYHPNEIFGMREMGRAHFYDAKKNPTGWFFFSETPIVRSVAEFNANKNAIRQITNDTERKKALKILEPRFGQYVVNDIFGLFIPRNIISESTAKFAGTVAGHITSRLPQLRFSKQHERFGYVFSGAPTKAGKEPTHVKKALGLHQVYASTARAA